MKKILCIVVAAVMLLSMTGLAYGTYGTYGTYGNAETQEGGIKTAFVAVEKGSVAEIAAIETANNKLNSIISKIFKQIQQTKPENPQQNQTATSGQQSSASVQVNTKSSQVVSLVNKERTKAGLPSLKTDSQLSKLAQLKAEDMAKNNYFSHTSPTYGSAFDMMKKYGVSYKSAGENIAKGQKTPSEVMTGWMNSQGHRANILSSSYTSVGVGYAADKNGTTYWVQIFKG